MNVMEDVQSNVEMLPGQVEPLVDQGGLWHAGMQGVKRVKTTEMGMEEILPALGMEWILVWMCSNQQEQE